MSENWLKMEPRGTQKNTKNEHRKTVNKCLKKGDAVCAARAVKVRRGRVPHTELLRRTTIQANRAK